jgi:hypothetical protein
MDKKLVNTISQRITEPSDTMLWKYMNRDKFEYLIKNEVMFMANRKLWFDGDANEGKLTRETEEELIAAFGPDKGRELIKTNQDLQDRVFGASFCTKNVEVKQMWDEYAPEDGIIPKIASKTGISIVTRWGRLAEAFEEERRSHIRMSRIHYFNRDKAANENNVPPGMGDPVNVAFFKEYDHFEWEQETRVVFYNHVFAAKKLGDSVSIRVDWKVGFGTNIIEPVDLNVLIERVVVSYRADPNYRQDVEDYLRGHGVTCPVVESMLKV